MDSVPQRRVSRLAGIDVRRLLLSQQKGLYDNGILGCNWCNAGLLFPGSNSAIHPAGFSVDAAASMLTAAADSKRKGEALILACE